MRVTRAFMVLFAVACAAGGCAQQPRVLGVPMAAGPAPQGIDNMVYGAAPTRGYAAAPVPQRYVAAAPYRPGPVALAPAPAVAVSRGLPFTTGSITPGRVYPAGVVAAAPAVYAGPVLGPPAFAPAAYPLLSQPYAYTLDSGDRLRVVVFGQEGLTNSYWIDAGGLIDMPLIGAVAARGLTTEQLSGRIGGMLRQGFIREPHVAVEIEAYRPFFILGEVAQPGQYPYVANMTVETAVAIAGGFGPRGYRKTVILSRNMGGEQFRSEVPLTTPMRPGDTIQVEERWF